MNSIVIATTAGTAVGFIVRSQINKQILRRGPLEIKFDGTIPDDLTLKAFGRGIQALGGGRAGAQSKVEVIRGTKRATIKVVSGQTTLEIALRARR